MLDLKQICLYLVNSQIGRTWLLYFNIQTLFYNVIATAKFILNTLAGEILVATDQVKIQPNICNGTSLKVGEVKQILKNHYHSFFAFLECNSIT